MNVLDSLDVLVEEDNSVPSYYESVLYFFLKQGVDFNTFCSLPLPYIFIVIKSRAHESRLEQEQK